MSPKTKTKYKRLKKGSDVVPPTPSPEKHPSTNNSTSSTSSKSSPRKKFTLSSSTVTEVRKVIVIPSQLKVPYSVEDFRMYDNDEDGDSEDLNEEIPITPHTITPHTPVITEIENDFSFQDLSVLKIPLLNGSLSTKPYKIKEFVMKNDLMINLESAAQLLLSRNLFFVLQRRRDPKVFYKTFSLFNF
jgi:hypothetical protein